MAQSGFTPIQLYSSPTPGNTPAASNLTNGELAINVADGKLFFKNTAGNTQVLADSTWAAYSSGVGLQGSGTSVVNTGTVQFANSNGVTFGLNGSTMTASVNSGPSIQGSGTNIASSGTVQFANSNGVTFGLNGNTMTATVAPTPITVSAGTTSAALNNVVFASSNGISFGLTSNTVTAESYSTQYKIADYAGPYLDDAVIFSASVGIPFGIGSQSDANISVFPFTINNAIAFNRFRAPAFLGTSGISFLPSTTASASTAPNYTYTMALSFGLYTLTGDTLSLYTSASYTVGHSQTITITQNASNVTRSFSATLSASFPTAISAGSLVYTTSSVSRTSTYGAGAVVPLPSVYGNYQGSQLIEVPLYPSASRLPASTYFLVQGLGSTVSFTHAGFNATDPWANLAVFNYSDNKNTARGLLGNEMIRSNAAPAFSAYSMIFAGNSGGNTGTIFGHFSFGGAFPGSSFASTAYTRSLLMAGAGTTSSTGVYIPKITLA